MTDNPTINPIEKAKARFEKVCATITTKEKARRIFRQTHDFDDPSETAELVKMDNSLKRLKNEKKRLLSDFPALATLN